MTDGWNWPQWWFAVGYAIAIALHVFVIVCHDSISERLIKCITLFLACMGIYALHVARFW